MGPRYRGWVLPALYARWLQDALTLEAPPESRADCSDCPMTTAEGAAEAFDPVLRCCTYHPRLPAHRVGIYFRDHHVSRQVGRSRLEAKLHKRVGVTPLGIDAPPAYALLFRSGKDTFGRAKGLRCPYHDADSSLGCSIWEAREATCATWFCKHERGLTGRTFWVALRDFIHAADAALAWWCVLESDLGDPAIEAIDAYARGREAVDRHAIDEGIDPARYEAMWGSHRFAEHRWFAQCAARVEALSWEEVQAIGGSALERARHALRRAHAATLAEIPDRLEPAPLTLVSMSEGKRVLRTYSPYDQIEVSTDLLGVLELFATLPVDAVPEQAATRGVELDDDAIQRLVDFGLLCVP